MQNIKKFYVQGILNCLINLLFVGSVLQTVLLESGYSENTVNIYTSVMQIVQILTILLFSKQSDKLKNLKLTFAKSYLLQIPIAILVVLLCFLKGSSLILMFLIATSIRFNIALVIHNILSYKLPYKIMPMSLYGKAAAFLLFYGVTYFFINIINYAVPVTVVKIADYEIMGQYSAGRMLLNTIGTSLAGFACIPMFNLIGAVITIVVPAALQLFSGICYYLYLNKNINM